MDLEIAEMNLLESTDLNPTQWPGLGYRKVRRMLKSATDCMATFPIKNHSLNCLKLQMKLYR